MESNFILVFQNSLLKSKIFSYLDPINLGKVRFVCSKWAENVEHVLEKMNRYFALDCSLWPNRKDMRELNGIKLKWILDCFKMGNKFRLIQNVEFPIREVLECKEIREFFVNYGQLIKNLRLVKYEAFFVDEPFKTSGDCISPLQLIHLILTSWCPNLTSISIIEKLRNWTRNDEEDEYQFPQFVPNLPIFKEMLKLESLTIEFQVLNKFLSSNIPISYIKEIYRNSPNLKHAITIWSDGRIHRTEDLFFPEKADFGFYNLETFKLPQLCIDACSLTKITFEKFPRLKHLNVGIWEFSNIIEDYEGLLNHPGVKTLTIRTKLNMIPYSLQPFLIIAPHANSIRIVDGRPHYYYFSHGTMCYIKPGAYGNIRKLEIDGRYGLILVDCVKILGAACPNLELFKIKRKKGNNEELKIRAIAQEIIDRMEKLRQLELEYYGPNWVDEEWEELRGFLNTKLEEERGRSVRFYFGSEAYMKTRTSFF